MVGKKVETLKVQLAREKVQKVRETALKRFGCSDAAVNQALDEAVDDWITKNQSKKTKKLPDWESLSGCLKDVKMSSVELQHRAFLLKKE